MNIEQLINSIKFVQPSLFDQFQYGLFYKNIIIQLFYKIDLPFKQDMKRCEILKDIHFYSDPVNPESLVALLDVKQVKGLKSRTQYIWVNDNIIDCKDLKLILGQQLILISFQSVQQCFNEIVIRYSQDQQVSINIICTNLHLLEKLSQMCQQCVCVEFVYYFSILGSIKDVQQFKQIKKQGKVGKKFIVVPEGFNQLRRTLKQRDLLPNCMFLTEDQQKSNTLKATLQAMTKQSTNRSILYEQFYKLCKANISKQEIPILEEYMKILKDHQERPLTANQIFKYYSRQDFFHKIINKMLRKTVNPTQIFYIQPFVRDLFQAIKITHQKQTRNIMKRVFSCYRGASFSQKQLKQFQKNIGNYIECLGFLSTSYSRRKAQTFGLNVLITIEVKNVLRDKYTDYGYAFIEKHSSHEHEQQILFNMLSSFRIKSVQRDLQGTKVYISLEYGIYPQVLYKMKNGILLNQDEEKIKNIIGYQCETFCKNQGNVLFQNDYLNTFQETANLSYSYLQQICDLYQSKVDKTNQQKLQYANHLWKLGKLDLSRQNFKQSSMSIQKCINFCICQLLTEQLSDEHSCLIYESVLRLKAQLLFAIKEPQQAIQILDVCIELLKEYMHKQLKQYFVVLSTKAQCYILLLQQEKMRQQFALMKSAIQKYEPNNEHLWYMYRNTSKTFNMIFSADKRQQNYKDVHEQVGSILGSQQSGRRLSLFSMFEGENMKSYYKIMVDRLSRGQHPKFDAHKQLYYIFIQLENSQKYDQNSQKDKLIQVSEKVLKIIQKLYPDLKQERLYIDSLYKLSKLLIKIDKLNQCLQVNSQILSKRQKVSQQIQCQCLQSICLILIGFNNLSEIDVYIAEIDDLQIEYKQSSLIKIQAMYELKCFVEETKKDIIYDIGQLQAMAKNYKKSNVSLQRMLKFLLKFEEDHQLILNLLQQMSIQSQIKQQRDGCLLQNQATSKIIRVQKQKKDSEDIQIKWQVILQALRQKDFKRIKQMIKQFILQAHHEKTTITMGLILDCINYYLVFAEIDQNLGDIFESNRNHRMCLKVINNYLGTRLGNKLYEQLNKQIQAQQLQLLSIKNKSMRMQLQQEKLIAEQANQDGRTDNRINDPQSQTEYKNQQQHNSQLNNNHHQVGGLKQLLPLQIRKKCIYEGQNIDQQVSIISQQPGFNKTFDDVVVSIGEKCSCQLF